MNTPEFDFESAPDFDGSTYNRKDDHKRLTTLLELVRAAMSDHRWWTLRDLQDEIGRGSEASISARIRDLRKEKFGGLQVAHRRRAGGLWEYRINPPTFGTEERIEL